MEEDFLKKKEDEMKDNEFKEPKKGNGLIIGLLVVIIIGLAGFIVYDKVIKKDEPKGNDTPVPTSTPEPVVTPTITNTPEPVATPTVTSTPKPASNDSKKIALEKKKISNKNTSYELNGKTLKIRTYDNSLYVNDAEVYKADIYDGTFKGFSIYINKNSEYAFIEVNHDNLCGSDNGYIDGAIDSNGKPFKIEVKEGNDYVDLPACSRSVYSKNGKYYATISGVDDINEKDFSYTVEYVIK